MIKSNVIRISNRNTVKSLKQTKNKSSFDAYKIYFKKCFESMNDWLGIDGCINSQIWFYGTFGLSIFMLTFTYIISGILYGF